jgi:hypothetical protein
MNRSRTFLALTLVSIAAPSSLAQSQGGQFAITKSTLDGGGGVSSQGSFEVRGTIGQPDASLQSAVGGIFTVTGGFWAGSGAAPEDLIFSDGFENP